MKRTFIAVLLRVGAGVLAVTSTVLAAALVPTDSVATGAQAWYRSLSPSERQVLGDDPARVVFLPVEYRRTLLPTLAGRQQANVWREVFANFKKGHVLSAEQASLVAQAEALLTPALFDRHSAEDLAAVALVRGKLVDAIGRAEATELFATAGPEGERGALAQGELARYEWRRARQDWTKSALAAFIPTLRAAGDCNCRANDDCFLSYCGDAEGCAETSWKCGSWYLEHCTALCHYPS
ncbi:MAG: bacteriocin fulvocin C-related protein [Gemmatimonadaceae bacterium]|nr:bacteriocin fulvocin C-related protein [Gemmatimonadaceae bacterium]